VNWLSAALALGANLFYVFGYSVGLKRRTPQKHRLGRVGRLLST
jgi:heme O synthase-like polyprenyltransferase